MPATVAPLLEAIDITKTYGSNEVLSKVSLSVAPGEIVGLIGENGAGKSTLLNILSGVVSPDAGKLRRNGAPIAPSTYREASRSGIIRVFQDSALIDNLRVYENLFFGWEHFFTGRLGLLDRRAMLDAARKALDAGGLTELAADRPISDLAPGERQALDIARAVATADLLGIEAPVILFDEPTTALDSANEENFLRLLERLRGRAGVVFVSHRLGEVLRSCDRIVVLKDGKRVADAPASGLTDADLHRLMVGRERTGNYYREDRQKPRPGPARLEVNGIAIAGAYEPVSFALAPGEVLGLAGTDGSGKRRLAQTIAGERSPDRGEIRVDGKRLRTGVPAAVAAGVAFVPGERQHDGLIVRETILANFELPSLHDLFSNAAGFRLGRKARTAAERYIAELEISAPNGVESRIDTLSGGNQQKVLLAKWLVRDPRVLVLENPTQGVDTGAREAIYRAVRDAAARGVAVVIVSDDLPELIGLSDRILILVEGRSTRLLDAAPGAKPEEAAVVAEMIPAGIRSTPGTTPGITHV
ncbi:sugar ABC transporter ATP-binding protein [Kaistia terrae]|uniref:Sugar ABC transporter ATP-binding protein n=1 Tax=Kaistia terrae TaxID=537017 RepID=A0ABW0PYR4_9HYPH|nr:sugar ABC transporter ATP-binding protein [Kaistia terrae]MCX5580875.1 sugar ABC transporter ATP-binding protein [Kaistia terrae]